MADNLGYSPGVGATIASDEIGGVQFQRVKIVIGADGVNGGDVAAANAMPISASSLPLPAGAATEATLALVSGTDITTPVPAMPAGGVGIRGWLSAIWTKLNGSLAVTGTFWQATQPVSGTVTANAGTGTLAVSGPLTDVQLRAVAVPVSGTVTANAGTNLNTSALNLEATQAAMSVSPGQVHYGH